MLRKKGNAKEGQKLGISADLHVGPIKGGINASITKMDDSNDISMSLSGSGGGVLGFGLPDVSPLGGDIEASAMYKPALNFNYNKQRGTIQRSISHKMVGSAELSGNLGTGAMLEAGIGRDVTVDLQKREVHVDDYLAGSASLHLPTNAGQAVIKLGAEPKTSLYYTRFIRQTYEF